jgi:SAM-dependent methyltransferase
MASTPTRHLDLGCGLVPRNPYGQDELFGVDIAAREQPGCTIVRCNLALEALPFAAGHFDSVSAFDLIEHVPRVLVSADGLSTRCPFIELMNEISRVLRPGGLLYALTPCYPSPEAFQDPTHVNIITDSTHLYFTGGSPLGRMYGFSGDFRARRVEWVVSRDNFVARPTLSLHQRFRRFNYRRKGQLSHLLWEFECSKPA